MPLSPSGVGGSDRLCIGGTGFTVTTSGGITNAGGADRPNRIADGTLPSDQRSIDRWFDESAFKPQAQYTYGNSGRNILFGPGLRNIEKLLRASVARRCAEKLQVFASRCATTDAGSVNRPTEFPAIRTIDELSPSPR
jgi:hypothetical protein